MKKKVLIISIPIIIIIIACLIYHTNNQDLITVKSERELLKLYDDERTQNNHTFLRLLGLPFTINELPSRVYDDYYYEESGLKYVNDAAEIKDYSQTNIQVENVDEADIVKTDGNYIYSISDNNVIITDVRNPESLSIVTTILSTIDSTAEDLIIYKNKLVIIYEKIVDITDNRYYYYYHGKTNTIVKIYNIENRESPYLEKSYELYEPYYTSRCIDNTLYIISSGLLRKKDDKIVRTYIEDGNQKEIPLNNIQYLKDVDKQQQTIIATYNLDDPQSTIDIKSYLINASNCYVSENSIYLLNQYYKYSDDIIPIKTIFGIKGIFGLFTYYDDYDFEYGQNTQIYKFDISKSKKISYNSKNEIPGTTINQYSLDEQNGHLRVAIYNNKGTRVIIFDEKLKQIGASDWIAEGEKMYASRFIGDKAYLVTYKTIDPLFVIDLSNEKHPEVLGELHIPGYSTYLHPYDENHLIGIGMQTKEIIRKDINGKIISNNVQIVGMKMALFDISNVTNPIQISETIIGDDRVTSAILTNPKALLFSKEKELIAIPINQYSEDFEFEVSSDTYSSIIDSYKNYDKDYIGEGYLVYNINLTDGFSLKGVITHETDTIDYKYYYYTALLRGLYIGDNLYTVSENMIKVNDLNTLEPLNEIELK